EPATGGRSGAGDGRELGHRRVDNEDARGEGRPRSRPRARPRTGRRGGAGDPRAPL
ncbi:MAG: hypothetical protein AVDCRST_MAG02-1481, partial [uncultured Rubrobacteraceae bacterium]